MKYTFETTFPSSKEELINVVLLDRTRILAIIENCAEKQDSADFNLLSEEEKAIIKIFSISEEGEVSVEFHDVIKASEILMKLGVSF